MLSLAVVILTYNEERNLPHALESVCHWASEVFVVDSYSTDRTLDIAKEFSVGVFQNEWENFAVQRNWALDNLPISADWVFFLDADEVATSPFRKALNECLRSADSQIAAIRVRQRFIFLGRELKYVHSAPPLVRVVQPEKVKWHCVGMREFAEVDGKMATLSTLLDHQDRRGLTAWIDKHNTYASMEAEELLTRSQSGARENRSNERGVRYWLLQSVWPRLPLFIRPFINFFYVYLLQFGFLDGWQGFVYSFMHELWYRMLIDAKYMELKLERK
jgi:glycosyltransferase involved in cell wall biosynthesis